MNLPPLMPFAGDWDRYEEKLYRAYLETVVDADLKFQGLPVRSQFRPETKGKGFSFWHIISEGPSEEERTPDLKRCERIKWIGWMIEHATSHLDLSWWENRRGRNTHVVIWHEKESFAVVLAKRNRYYLLKTAYWVKSRRADDFRRERANFHGS